MANDTGVPEISVLDLARALEHGEPLQIVDVRAPARVAQGRIDLVLDSRFHNIVGSTLIAYSALDGTGIDPSLPVVVVCGHGICSSATVRRSSSIRRWRPRRTSRPRPIPAHYGGEAERNADRSVGAPFGQLLQANPSLQFSTREPFAAWVESKNASFPEAYKRIKAVNVALVEVSDQEAEELEIGRNECALGRR